MNRGTRDEYEDRQLIIVLTRLWSRELTAFYVHVIATSFLTVRKWLRSSHFFQAYRTDFVLTTNILFEAAAPE